MTRKKADTKQTKKTSKKSASSKTNTRKKKKEEVVIEEAKPVNKRVSLVFIIISLVLCLISLIKLGTFGLIINNILSFLFGNLYIVVLVTVIAFLIRDFLNDEQKEISALSYVGIFVLNIAFMALSALIAYSSRNSIDFSILKELNSGIINLLSDSFNYGGGIVGSLIYILLVKLLDKIGALLIVVLLFVISLIFIVPSSTYRSFINSLKVLTETASEQVDRAREEKERKERIEKARIKAEADRLKKLEYDNKLAELHTENPTVMAESEVFEVPLAEEDKEIKLDETFSKLKIDLQEPEKEDLPSRKEVTEPCNEVNIQTTIIDHKGEMTGEVTTEVKPKIVKRANPFENYRLPHFRQLLVSSEKSHSNKNEQSASIRGVKLIEILKNFGIKATLKETHIGPSVTKFEIVPDATVNLSKISSLTDNIKMGLMAKDIRIEAPIPGKNAVGVEVPNAENTMVRMSELISKVPNNKLDSKLLFALGKDLMGTPVFCELNKMPHLLIAGATGSGKSVCINTIITSFLLRTKPDDVKLVLVDPKKVEFTPYHDVPHLLWPVITDSKMASLMLKKIVAMMDDRYNLFAAAGVREINSYNAKVVEHNANLKEGEEEMAKLPFIVVIIDELADMMQIASKDVEGSIQRITQLARASGIHLIVATQRPSTDVITGLIKSNIPSRISFAVSSSIDSRTILDQVGAEKLLGNGDMLYSPQGENAPIRLQGCYVTDDEISKICDYCKSQAKPDYDDTFFELKNNGEGGGLGSPADDNDDLYNECVQFVAKTKKASTSSLQRRFGIGYNRAARIIDAMEERGLIGPANGSKPREVYIRESQDEQE